MKNYVQNRIKTDYYSPKIVAGSTPVVFFGKINTARVATLGINPSKNEFINKGSELTVFEQRFQTLSSLNATSLSSLTNKQVQKVYNSCLNYFRVNPYRKWFDQLDRNILKKINVSYYDNTACHIDLVQWATDPIWRSLKKRTKEKLLASDLVFLNKQLFEEKIETLLINGREATNIFQKEFRPELIKHNILKVDRKSCNVYSYSLSLSNKKIKVFAWSNNLQSTIGLTNLMRNKIGNWIKKEYCR